MTAGLDTFWQKDRSWWTADENFRIHLTDKAPQEAIDSFNRYQKQIKEKNKDPKRHVI